MGRVGVVVGSWKKSCVVESPASRTGLKMGGNVRKIRLSGPCFLSLVARDSTANEREDCQRDPLKSLQRSYPSRQTIQGRMGRRYGGERRLKCECQIIQSSFKTTRSDYTIF